MPLTRDEDIYALLAEARTIAMIGASDRPDRPSYGVMAYLQGRGYRVLPVNPQITGEHVHGEYVWRELAQIGEPIDMVDIFRRPAAAGVAPARRNQRGSRCASRGSRPQGGHEPLPQDRDSAAGRAEGRLAATGAQDPNRPAPSGPGGRSRERSVVGIVRGARGA
jgi:hypothetical protein